MPQSLSEPRRVHAAEPEIRRVHAAETETRRVRAPETTHRRASSADHIACREMIKVGSKSFYAASLILPHRVRRPAYALYAFCRLADDAVDEGDGDMATVRRLRRRLRGVYAGRPADSAPDRAFAEVVAAFGIPEDVPSALIEGLAWDAEGWRYASLAELHAYSARVAGTVGVMMTLLMGVRAPEALARACDLGVAMQLSNIARDVGEDARNGRVYLPLDWLAEEEIAPDAFLADPQFTPALGRVVARLLEAAEGLYARASSGIAALPMDCRPAIMASRMLYREIGRTVARAGYDSVSERAVVSTSRKLALVAQAASLAPLVLRGSAEAALAETRFLVDAVLAEPGPANRRRSVGEKIDRALDVLVAMRVREHRARLTLEQDGQFGKPEAALSRA